MNLPWHVTRVDPGSTLTVMRHEARAYGGRQEIIDEILASVGGKLRQDNGETMFAASPTYSGSPARLDRARQALTELIGGNTEVQYGKILYIVED